MSHSIHTAGKTFQFCKSDEEYKQFLTFAEKHMRQVDRLAEALEKQPATVEGNERVLKQPIHITANAKGFKV